MAFISLQQLYDSWKRVSDWVTGADTISAPKVTVTSSALPTGAATEAKQDSEIAKLTSIDGKVATAAKQDTGNTSIAAINTTTGATTDAEASSGNGSVIAILKGIRTFVGGVVATLGSAIGTKATLIAGSDGTNAQAIKTNTSGEVLMQLTGSYHQKVTIANAVNITTTTAVEYNLITHGGLTEAQIRQIEDWQISIFNTHTNAGLNATATFEIYKAVPAFSTTSRLFDGKIYGEAAAIADGTNGLLFASGAGGTGAAPRYKQVSALKGVTSNLIVRITFANAPTSGAITIVAEGRG